MHRSSHAWRLLAALPLIAASHTASGAEARGVVFHDLNADGVRQANEPGIAGVAVSDGQRVVRTDASGRYRIEIDDEDAIVFVVKPRDYQVVLDEQNIPRGYYIHKPKGSPDDGFVFPGVDPTGPMPRSIDFPLRAAEEPSAFTVIAMGDPQPYSLEQIDFYRREVIDPLIASDGNKHKAAFGISLGDLVGDNLDLFEPLNEAQSLLGVPWYNVYGNHDMNFMSGHSSTTKADPDRYADDTFERVFGPPNYAFQYADVHFIILDNVYWQGFDGYRDQPDPNWPTDRKPNTGNYRGALRPDQIDFVENYLGGVPADELVVLAFHIPMEMQGEGVHRIPEKRALLKALSGHPHTLSLSGHTHFQQHWFFGPDDGYKPTTAGGNNQHAARDPGRFPAPVHHHINAVTASGSWYNGLKDEAGIPHTTMRDGAPNGYTLLHFDGNRYTSDFRAARRPADDQMGIFIGSSESEGVVAAGDQADITVNVYNGAVGDEVMMRVLPNPALAESPTSWQRLAFAPGTDPRYVQTHARETDLPEHLNTGWGLPGPQTSYHLWSGNIPADLAIGTHVLEIRHTDLYGRVLTDRRTFRVTE